MEQGSYLLIEPGMAVHGSDARDLGSVAEVVADTGADIFRGIVVTHGLLLPRRGFIGAESIVSVIGNDIATSVTKEQFDRLPADHAALGASSASIKQ